jgi:nucleoside-diphosphate-sugar epimerase
LRKNLVLVTGASGFVGTALCASLVKQGYAVRVAVRNKSSFALASCEVITIPNIETVFDWSSALDGVNTVIHLAARVHVMRDHALDPQEEFRKVNVYATERLAEHSALKGVKRFVYVSSIKVNGEDTQANQKFTDLSMPAPQDCYGVSKYEAELSLQKVSKKTGLEIVILRPPLVYGAGVKGNFLQMINILNSGLPLPLAKTNNKRSLLYVENLVDALILCSWHPSAAGMTYLLSDGLDISTTNLLEQLGAGLGCPARLFPFPSRLLELAASLIGKENEVQRVLGSLQIDSSKIRQELGWKPPFTIEEGLKLTVRNMDINNNETNI